MRFRPLPFALALAALSLAFGARAEAMTFEAVSGPAPCQARACILASGDIDDRTAGDFAEFLKVHPTPRGGLVILDSPGGDLLQSLKLGNEIRDAGLDTAAGTLDRKHDRFSGGACASACVYAFLGGVDRSVEAGGKLGVHQIYVRGDTWALSAQDGLRLMSLVGAHVQHLCGRLDLLIPAMDTPPEQMHWLSKGELVRYAVVTDHGEG